MIHQLHGANGQHLFGEVTGIALHSSDTATVIAVAQCFRPLLCALLNLTSIKSLRSVIEKYHVESSVMCAHANVIVYRVHVQHRKCKMKSH